MSPAPDNDHRRRLVREALGGDWCPVCGQGWGCFRREQKQRELFAMIRDKLGMLPQDNENILPVLNELLAERDRLRAALAAVRRGGA